MIALCAGLNVALYRAVLPLALRVLEQRREVVLRAVTRE
jgi:ABC-2 type transport system permease protein